MRHRNRAYKTRHNKRLRVRVKRFLSELKEEHGGKCTLCGYDKNYSSLVFHHLDPSNKSFAITAVSGTVAIKNRELVRDEAKKCVLLCANCHQDLHNPESRKHG